MAQDVETRAGGDHRRQVARVVRVDDADGWPQRAMRDAGLGVHLDQIKDRHTGGLAASPRGGWNRHQWLERSWDGKALAERIRSTVAGEVSELGEIGLTTILVGDDSASEIYITRKHAAAAAAGFRTSDLRYAASITEALEQTYVVRRV